MSTKGRPCKDCVHFSQTYKFDIEREDHAYQFGTCTAANWWRLDGPRARFGHHSMPMDRDAVHPCFESEKRPVAGPGFF